MNVDGEHLEKVRRKMIFFSRETTPKRVSAVRAVTDVWPSIEIENAFLVVIAKGRMGNPEKRLFFIGVPARSISETVLKQY